MKRETRNKITTFLSYVIVFGLAVMLTIGLLFVVVELIKHAPASQPPQPPAMDAPLLDIVRWCETHARERKTRAVMVPVQVGKTTTLQSRTQVYYVDSPEMFLDCMQSYEYMVKR